MEQRQPRKIHTGDDIHVWTNGSGQIEPAIRIGLALMYAVHTVPVIFAFWFLSLNNNLMFIIKLLSIDSI